MPEIGAYCLRRPVEVLFAMIVVEVDSVAYSDDDG